VTLPFDTGNTNDPVTVDVGSSPEIVTSAIYYYLCGNGYKSIYITYMNKLLVTMATSVMLVGSALADNGAASNTSNNDVTVESVWTCIGDLLLVRPIGAAATVAGFGVFAVASPFAAMADATEKVYDTVVTAPGEYTFCRDLGDFSK
jgi:hypothetical protein